MTPDMEIGFTWKSVAFQVGLCFAGEGKRKPCRLHEQG
jgi:hypothetical protein